MERVASLKWIQFDEGLIIYLLFILYLPLLLKSSRVMITSASFSVG